VDTSGWAFTYPLARLAGARVAAYTHYPTMSTDMLQRVQSGAAGYNNSAAIAASGLRSAAKLAYYYMFAAAYGAAGGCAQVGCLLIQLACTTCICLHATDHRRPHQTLGPASTAQGL
jgi:alpha-1,2-mannosyltransferase